MTTRTLVISQNPTQQNDFSCILKLPIIIIFAEKLIQILDNSKIPKFFQTELKKIIWIRFMILLRMFYESCQMKLIHLIICLNICA